MASTFVADKKCDVAQWRWSEKFDTQNENKNSSREYINNFYARFFVVHISPISLSIQLNSDSEHIFATKKLFFFLGRIAYNTHAQPKSTQFQYTNNTTTNSIMGLGKKTAAAAAATSRAGAAELVWHISHSDEVSLLVIISLLFQEGRATFIRTDSR